MSDIRFESNITDSGPIEVNSVELYARDNAQSHNTHLYDLLDSQDSPLILRRSHSFYLGIRFQTTFGPKRDKVRIYLEFGQPPYRRNRGNLTILPLTSKSSFSRSKETWDVRLQKHEREVITVDVQIPSNAAVGVWKMKIISYVEGNSNAEPVVFEIPQSIYILFNPWSKYDAVYLENKESRRQFVLNDTGKIFRGAATSFVGRQWHYKQFADVALLVSMELLNRSKLNPVSRASPIVVSRVISKLVNSNDNDQGIIVGRWGDNYDDGVAPWEWLGSLEILEQYYKAGLNKPVRYGQCWVFAGVTTTVCRALGIPCRTVTNFSSAHDENGNLTIERYFSEDGEMTDQEGVWNFHVWNDCWMTRPDLPSGYGGWQCVDSTPQELSDGKFQLGPAPVEAIRQGQIGFNYDCRFVFAEVNADVLNLIRDPKSESGWRRVSLSKVEIGRLILTQKVGTVDYYGDRDAENITGEYKPKEGSDEDRRVMLNAASFGVLGRNRIDVHDPPSAAKDVSFDLQDIEQIMIGQPFSATLKVKNNSTEKRTINTTLSASTMYYTGTVANEVSKKKDTFPLQPNQDKEIAFVVPEEEYFDKLVTYCMMKIYVLATVEETEQAWTKEIDFTFRKPSLKLEMPENAKIDQPFQLTVNFTNPLKRLLTECKFTIEGPGLRHPRKVDFRDIQPEESISHTETLTPKKPGSPVVTVHFNTKQLIEMMASKQISVSQ